MLKCHKKNFNFSLLLFLEKNILYSSLICAIFAPLFLNFMIMKSVKYLFLAAFAALSFFSCNNVKSDVAPSAVALKVYEGLTSGDVKAVTDNIYFVDTLDHTIFREYLEVAVASADYKKRTQGFKASYKVVSEQVNGKNASVVLEGIGPLGNMLKIDVKLLSVDGSWKVDGNHGVFHSEPINKK